MDIFPNYHYGKQRIEPDDIEAVVGVLKSDFISQGPMLEAFEKRVAEYCGARYCLAVANGTAGIHLACQALDLGDGDNAWTSPLTFVATANSIRHSGATVDFVDIEPKTLNMSVQKLEQMLYERKRAGRLPKIVIPVHFAGLPCQMTAIKKLADHYGIKIIEDACQALGGSEETKKIGSCQFSDIAVFSLHPVKSITTGEGGLVTTNDPRLYEKMKRMRAHGMVRGGDSLNSAYDPWLVEMQEEGFNYRLTEFQCALGLKQLNKLDRFIEKRTILAERYIENLSKIPVRFQQADHPCRSAWHMMVLRMNYQRIDGGKREFYHRMQQAGINLSLHYYPVHLHRFYRNLGFCKGMLPNCEKYYEEAFTYPLHPGLSCKDIDYICDRIKTISEEIRS